jgi:hypothetical protein
MRAHTCRSSKSQTRQKRPNLGAKENYYMRTFESEHRRRLQTKPVSKETYYSGKKRPTTWAILDPSPVAQAKVGRAP